jgi:predicted DNA-binding transcriptional regulator YafY
VQAGRWAAATEDHAEIAFSPDVAWWAVGSFAGAREVDVDDQGWIVADVPMGDPDLLASLILQFGPDAVVRSPDPLRDEVVRRLEAIVV